jgi:hypothetical protein
MTDPKPTSEDTVSLDDLVADVQDMDKAMTTFEALDDAGQDSSKAAEKAQTYALVAIARALTIGVLLMNEDLEEDDGDDE